MEYTAAFSRAWSELAQISQEKKHFLRFLSDDYDIDLEQKRILSLSCNAPAKAHYSILILHYLIQSLKGLPPVKGEWISFKQLAGGQGYYPAFKKRVIDTIMRKYSANPESLYKLSERFPVRVAEIADISIVLQAFEALPILITFWRGDEEFGPQANVLFDKNISTILCTEDVVVLAEIVAHSI